MRIKLLSANVGLILGTSPEKVYKSYGKLDIAFENAPEGATVNFTSVSVGENISLVRTLEPKSLGACSVPLDKLGETVHITVSEYGTQHRVWLCESIRIIECADCYILVPADFDWREKVNNLALENEALRVQMAELNGRIVELNKKVETAFEGYDVI